MDSNVMKIYMLSVCTDEGEETLYASSTFDGLKRKIAEVIAFGQMVYEPFRDKDSKTQAEVFSRDFTVDNLYGFGTDLSFLNRKGDIEIGIWSIEDSGNTVKNVRPNQVLKTLYFTTEEFDELLNEVFGGGVKGNYSECGMYIKDDAGDFLTIWEIYHDLAKYLNVNEITSIHNDHYEVMGIWVAYK